MSIKSSITIYDIAPLIAFLKKKKLNPNSKSKAGKEGIEMGW
jgi:hypothetical protein